MLSTTLIEQLNAVLAPMGFQAMGRCACKGKPYRWKKGAYEFKLFQNLEWKLTLSNNIVRYGKAETAIEEVQEYFNKLMA
jgi:hypothetical protein